MRRLIRSLIAVALVIAFVSAAGALVTGRVAYEVTNGTSMVPTYHHGDLAIVVKADSYRRGQVVAYRSRIGGVVLLHRIVGGDASGYVLKGDNNQSTDVTHPTANQVLGRAVVHIPQVGALARSPLTRVLLLAFSIGVLLLWLLSLIEERAGAGADVLGRRERRRRWAWKPLAVADVVLLAALVVSCFVTPGSPGRRTARTPAGGVSSEERAAPGAPAVTDDVSALGADGPNRTPGALRLTLLGGLLVSVAFTVLSWPEPLDIDGGTGVPEPGPTGRRRRRAGYPAPHLAN